MRSKHLLWPSVLILALAFLTVDSAVRVRSIHKLSASYGTQTPPQPDAKSATGYEHEQHRLILPSLGTDGYHWIMQTERMFAGDGFRIRRADYDNAPQGREVHWSGSVRWWLATVAGVYSALHPELSMPQAIERVAPWANTLALAFLMLCVTPLLARRLGAVAAALFPLGCVAVQPFYQYWLAGFLDHHGFAAMACFGAVICLVAGGGGWVRAAAPDRLRNDDAATWQRLLEPRVARMWFMISAIIAGAGLWISAATLVPVMVGIAGGAILSTGWLARTRIVNSPWRAAPELWRLWGVTGCVTSLAFYALEYFPSHMGLRLEVNHPLYAFAWLGAGDLLYRVCSWLALVGTSSTANTTRSRLLLWVIGDVVMIALLPAVILVDTDTFRVTDAFLWALHQDYILEFRSLGSQFSSLSSWHFLTGTTSLLPVALVPLAALLWSTSLTGVWKAVWRALLIAVVIFGMQYFHALVFTSVAAVLRSVNLLPSGRVEAGRLVQLVSLVPDAVAFGVLFLCPARRGFPTLRTPLQGVLVLALIPAAVLLLLAFVQVRWLGVNSVLLLAALITAAAVLTANAGTFEWTRARRVVGAICIVLVFAPFLLFTLAFPWRHGYPAVMDEVQVVTRDIAYLLRARLGDQRGVVVSGPTSTTWLTYFGGFQGLGTLYWENRDGLAATAAIYGARTNAEARALIERHGVTHLAIHSWDPFVREYPRLARGQRLDRRNPTAAPTDAFMVRLLQTDSLPDWLTRIPYELPATGFLKGAGVWIYEVVQQPRATE